MKKTITLSFLSFWTYLVFGQGATGLLTTNTDAAILSVSQVPSNIVPGGSGTIVVKIAGYPVTTSGTTTNRDFPPNVYEVRLTETSSPSLFNFSTTAPLASSTTPGGVSDWTIVTSTTNIVTIKNAVVFKGDGTQFTLTFNIVGLANGTASFKGEVLNAPGSNAAYGDANLMNNSIVSSVILPIDLVGFSASALGNNALIKWSTSQEINVGNFTVERSATTDGGNGWATLGSVKPTNTLNTHNYQFIDQAPLAGNNFYRLRSIDNDGTVTISKTVSLNFANDGFKVTLYPSPVRHSATLKIGGESATSYTIVIIDIAGKPVGDRVQVQGNTSTILNFENLSSGAYMLIVKDAVTSKQLNGQLFIKQ